MVDSRQKGARAESDAKKLLIKHTGLNWQRTPLSGALDEKHGLKGDLYIPDCKQIWCVEVKHYKDDHLTSKVLTGKNPQLFGWWDQTERESKQVDRKPMLIFKYDRSKWFIAVEEFPTKTDFINLSVGGYELFVSLLEDYMINEKPEFIA